MVEAVKNTKKAIVFGDDKGRIQNISQQIHQMGGGKQMKKLVISLFLVLILAGCSKPIEVSKPLSMVAPCFQLINKDEPEKIYQIIPYSDVTGVSYKHGKLMVITEAATFSMENVSKKDARRITKHYMGWLNREGKVE